jgi:dihydropteroate synthase
MAFTTRPRSDWQLRTRTLALGQRTRVMGILNLTPDSFSDGGQLTSVQAVVDRAGAMRDDGADLLDLGAESTRPNATPMGSNEEQARLLPPLESIRKALPHAILSVDTYHAETARTAIAAGAEVVNDVSGLTWDDGMAEAVACTGAGLILMHARGRPQEWSTLPPLTTAEVVPHILRGLAGRLQIAASAGIPRNRIVLDPGFGFGIAGAANLSLLAHLSALQSLHLPLLAGLSRKGFLADPVARALPELYATAKPTPAERLAATTAGNVAAILGGAHLIRVHDVRAAAEAAAIADAVLDAVTA